jgi:hypothetical protein
MLFFPSPPPPGFANLSDITEGMMDRTLVLYGGARGSLVELKVSLAARLSPELTKKVRADKPGPAIPERDSRQANDSRTVRCARTGVDSCCRRGTGGYQGSRGIDVWVIGEAEQVKPRSRWT